jgi:hypothetical protein
VIGGTLIFGGSASAIGVFFASVLLILLVTLMQIMQLPPGSQDMVQGVVVILVLALAGRDAIRTRPPRESGLLARRTPIMNQANRSLHCERQRRPVPRRAAPSRIAAEGAPGMKPWLPRSI